MYKKDKSPLIHNFPERKYDGTIKARGYAARSSQKLFTTKSENSSPTVLLEAMMLSCPIHKKEGIHIVVTDYTRSIPTCVYEQRGAYAIGRYFCRTSHQA
jgi:hypothetical protein